MADIPNILDPTEGGGGGSWQLIEEIAPGSAVSSVLFDNIPGTFTELLLETRFATQATSGRTALVLGWGGGGSIDTSGYTSRGNSFLTNSSGVFGAPPNAEGFGVTTAPFDGVVIPVSGNTNTNSGRSTPIRIYTSDYSNDQLSTTFEVSGAIADVHFDGSGGSTNSPDVTDTIQLAALNSGGFAGSFSSLATFQLYGR